MERLDLLTEEALEEIIKKGVVNVVSQFREYEITPPQVIIGNAPNYILEKFMEILKIELHNNDFKIPVKIGRENEGYFISVSEYLGIYDEDVNSQSSS